jgi:hypothetical protein
VFKKKPNNPEYERKKMVLELRKSEKKLDRVPGRMQKKKLQIL